jgi:hypothetical protein
MTMMIVIITMIIMIITIMATWIITTGSTVTASGLDYRSNKTVKP